MKIFMNNCLLFMWICINRIYCLGGSSNCGKVHITVNSMKETFIEMNWITDCNVGEMVPDYIVLSRKNVLDRDEHPDVLLTLQYAKHPSGYYKTNIKFWQPWLPGGWELSDETVYADRGRHCFPYWISSIKGNTTVDSKCLAIEPTWMSDNSKRIGNLKIGSMLIPGTHNSGAFSGSIAFFENYVLNQDRSVWTQLVFGIRYLDFRIGYYEREGYFINHDLVKITKIEPILQEIKKFIQLAPKEIIIIDFHRFPYPTNFTHQLHKDFIAMVYQELGQYALPSKDLQVGKGPTVNEMWTRNKSVIISYAHKETVQENSWLWHPIQQFWGDVKKSSDLQNFLEKSIRDHRHSTLNPMWALMAELTPQPIDILLRRNNLRKLAEDVNRDLTIWFRDEWGSEANIVATDYFLGNDLINVAITINTL